jgi:hypothetical protein
VFNGGNTDKCGACRLRDELSQGQGAGQGAIAPIPEVGLYRKTVLRHHHFATSLPVIHLNAIPSIPTTRIYRQPGDSEGLLESHKG